MNRILQWQNGNRTFLYQNFCMEIHYLYLSINISRIYEEWLHRHNATSDVYPENDQPGQGPDECATPYFPCYSNEHLLHRAKEFGYKYSTYKGM